MVGPCRPVMRDGKVMLDSAGNPVARRQPSAWVQVFAVALSQTKNTMKMLSVLTSPQLKRDYTVVIGKEQVVGLHGEVTIEAVTSSPETREGNRPTFQIGGEGAAGPGAGWAGPATDHRRETPPRPGRRRSRVPTTRAVPRRACR